MRPLSLLLLLLSGFIHLIAEEENPLIRDGAKRRESLYRFDVKDWRFSAKDIPGAEKEDLDDSSWELVEIGKPLGKALAVSGGSGSAVWYRKAFQLDRELPGLIWFEPGYISAGDTIYLNGQEIASTPHRGATFKCRRHLLKDAPFRKGKNLLAVRVQLGYMKGMYHGTPRLYRAELPLLLVGFQHKNGKADPLRRQLTGNEAIDIFAPDERIAIQQKFLLTSGKETECRLCYRLGNDEKTLRLKLPPRIPVVADTVEFPSPGIGKHALLVRVFLEGKLHSERSVCFTVEPRRKFTLPVRDLPDAANIRCNEFSLGSNGPRLLFRRKFLAEKADAPEIRGAAAGALAIGKKANGALPLFTHIDVPGGGWKSTDYDKNPGARYDGLETARPLGVVELPGRRLKGFQVSGCSWTARHYRLDYGDDRILTCSISQLAPGWHFSTREKQLRLFRPLKDSGASAPAKLYPGGKTRLTALEDNHFVVSWEDRGNWNKIDMPVVVILEHRPESVSLDEQGVLLSFPRVAGRVLLVPLYGVTPRPSEPLGERDMARARKLARLVPGLPDTVKRFISVDWRNSRLLVKDEFTRKPWRDDWNTPVAGYAPLPPSFMLAAASGTIRMYGSRNVTDCDYALNAGPLCVVEGSQTLTAIDGLTHFVREQRELAPAGKTDPGLAARLDEYVLRGLPELEKHPWPFFRASGRNISVGGLEPEFTNLLLAMPFLTETTRSRLLKAIDGEAPVSFTDDAMPVGGKHRRKKAAITPHVTNTATGKVLAVPGIHVQQAGIDGPCWIGNQISLLWNYAYCCGRMDFLKERKTHFERYLNTLCNSFDWASSVTWDSHSGLRVGNGLQESTIFYAAFASAAKFYHLCGDEEKRDEMAACALIHLAGISGVVSPRTNRWLRENRPWLPSHPDAEQIARDERLMPDHFLEFNERGGLFHSIMRGSGEPLFSDSWIMTRTPQVMRPFRELWGRSTDAHYRPTLPDPRFELPVPVDTFVYMTPNPPVPPERQFEIRMSFPMKDESRIADLRAILEYKKGIVWRALW